MEDHDGPCGSSGSSLGRFEWDNLGGVRDERLRANSRRRDSLLHIQRRILMPFKRISANRYRSPSGRVFTKSQVKRYYARGGKF